MSRDMLVENILTLLQELHNKPFKEIMRPEIPFPQMQLMMVVCRHPGMNMSFYSDVTMISKPNLTIISDKLIEDGLVERGFDEEDRRIITLNLTQKGRDFIGLHRKRVKEAVMQRLSNVDEGRITRINELFNELKDIFL